MLAAGIAALNRVVCVTDRREHVLRFAAVLVTRDRVRERLAVSGRSAIIDHQCGPSAAGVRLGAMIECGPLLAMRPAMDHHNHRVLDRGIAKMRFREERFNVPSVEALKPDRFDLCDRFARERIAIQRRYRVRQVRHAIHIQLGRC